MENVIVYRNNDTLQHHGILGQKWGLRRYQNPDGSLTPEGRARYLKALSTYQRNAGNAERSVVGSAVKSAALGSAAGAGLAILKGGDITTSALLSGGASAILGSTVAAAKNSITGAKLNKAIAIMEQFKELYGDKSVYEVTKDPKLEKKMQEVAKLNSQNTMRRSENNPNRYDLEFLERIDNPQYGELSDASLNKIYKKYKSGASWDTLYDMKERYEKLDNK